MTANGRPIALEGGYFLTPQGLSERGILLVREGKIEYVGALTKYNRDEYDVFDVSSYVVSPGLIDAHTHLGVYAEGQGHAGEDGNEMTDPVTPHVRALDALDPTDLAFEEARNNGITAVMITPGSANVIGGEICVAKTWGRTADEMVIAPYAGQKMATGENPKRVYGDQKKTPMTRMGIAALLRQTLTEAMNYRDKRRNRPDETEKNLKLESLIPVIEGKVPARIHAHRADDIMTAVRIAREFHLKLVIEHGTEAYKVADILADRKIPVNIGPASTARSKIELKDLVRDNAVRCMQAGCLVSLITDHPVVPIQDLRAEAAKLVRDYDADMNQVANAITINPAKTLGLDDRIGLLAPGRDADIAVFHGHPADPSATCVLTLIDGKIVHRNQALYPENE